MKGTVRICMLGTMWVAGSCVTKSSPCQVAQAELRQMAAVIDTAKINSGKYPDDLQELVNGGAVEESAVTDPWGHEYVYEAYSDSYSLYSSGADGVPRNEDDVGPKHRPGVCRVRSGCGLRW